MFSYARRLATSRRALWLAALACAALVALPAAVVAAFFIEPITMLLLTGDLGVSADLLPRAVSGEAWFVPSALVTIASLTLLYNRLYAVLLWESDEERSSGWRSSWSATRRVWVRVLALNAILVGVLVGATGVLVIVTAVALTASPGVATLLVFVGAIFLLALRTFGRIAITLAARGAILDAKSVREAWLSSRTLLRERRGHAVAAWASMLALGVAVWIGGRVVTPILQDTAFDYPAGSSYALARELAQLAIAIPLEAFLVVIAAGVWSAVYRGIDVEIAPSKRKPVAAPALAALVVLVIMGNGIPAVTDVAWRNYEDDRANRIRAREIDPSDALVASRRTHLRERSDHTRYRVTASLTDDVLEWTTSITYRNRSSTPLRELPVLVYPAAFNGDLEELPLVDDVLSATVSSAARAELEPGTFAVERVSDRSGAELRWERDGTLLTIDLERVIATGRRVQVDIALRADLPTWPLRYGVWRGITQLGNWIPTVPVRTHGDFVIHEYGNVGDPFFSAAADYAVELEIDGAEGVVGTGDLTAIAQEGEREVWRFEARDVRDAAFAAGEGLRGLEHDVGTTVRTWYNGSDSIEGSVLAREAASAFAYFSDAYGDISLGDVDVVRSENPLGGMEYPGLVFVSSALSQLEGLPLLPELVEHAGFQDQQERYVTGHEVAHQWWYAEVGNDQVREPWLDEGFAEASTRLWLLNEDGNERTWKIAHLDDEARIDGQPIAASTESFETNARYSDAVYDAGGELLIRLRGTIGAASYDSLMRSWFDRMRGDIATIDGFVRHVEEVAGPRAAALLQAHLTGRDR